MSACAVALVACAGGDDGGGGQSGAAGAATQAGTNSVAGAGGAGSMAGDMAAAGTAPTGMAGTTEAGAGGAGAGAGGAGAGGAAGTDAAGAGGTGVAGTDAAPRMDLGEGDGQDVITIGDSWMNLGTAGIQQSLVKVSGRPYRTYGVGGTRLLNEQIPMQYEQAKTEDADIKTVVMTGGGNDILQEPAALIDCLAGAGAACMMQIDMVAARLESLWAEMAADGVEDVIIIGYSRGATFMASIEYSMGVVTPVCAAAPLHCHAIDSDTIINADLRDGIHPTDAAYDLLGEAIWQLMQDEGMRR